MLSAGEHFALRSIDNIPGQGMTGIFAYRDKEGKWETAFSLSCDAIRARTPFMAAMDAQLGTHKDLAEKTGVEWQPKLELEVLGAMNKLHDLCNLNSQAAPPVIKTRVEP